MIELAAKRDPNRCPSHPGALLAELVETNAKSMVEVATALGVSRQHLYQVARSLKPVSPEMAVRLGKYFGNSGELWLRMQAAHDLWKAERAIDVDRISTIARKKVG